MTALVEVEALRVEFPRVIAVNRLSFELAEDEVLAIVVTSPRVRSGERVPKAVR